MSSVLSLTPEMSVLAMRGQEVVKISIGLYRGSEGFIQVVLSISGQSRLTETCTLICTPSCNLSMSLQLEILNSLKARYIKTGDDLGKLVTRTFKSLWVKRNILYSTS